MISFIRGTVSSVSENKVEIDTGSFGFEVNVPMSVIGNLPPVGEDTELYTHLNVKEDEMSLYGFSTRDELQMFRLLINVSGIGPKGAISMLSALTPTDIRFAVMAKDAKALSKAPGIGAKTAERIIIELKDRVSLEDSLDSFSGPSHKSGASLGDTSAKNEAITALTALGYSGSEALKAVNGIDTEGKTTEDILKEALKRL